MSREQVETELKYELPLSAALPDPTPVARAGKARTHHLQAVYLDTTDLLLLRHRVTLRRREGGTDDGWHLKLPTDGPSTRVEVHAPIGEGPGSWRVPEDLTAALADHLGEDWAQRSGAQAALVPVALLATRRTERVLCTPDGTRVAVLCDDVVTALPTEQVWRELEVEALPGHEDALPELADHLAEQGLQPAPAPSKLARALGDRATRAPDEPPATPEDRAADTLHEYLRQQVAVILGREQDLRADAGDAVHKTRVATRRLRSALRTFRRLLDRDVTDPLRAQIKAYADALGAPRDAEVMRQRLTASLDALPVELVHGPVRERVQRELEHRHEQALTDLVAVLDSPDYLQLTDALVLLLAAPPWRARAGRPARKVLPPLVARATERAIATWDAAAEAEGTQRLHLLHETRKRAKAVRYAAEALAPTFGEPAAGTAADWEEVTESLGRVQDAVVATQWLTGLAQVARQAGEPTFSYGVLVGSEIEEGHRAAEHGQEALRRATKGKRRRWMRR